METPSDEAAAAYAMTYRLMMHFAARGSKQDILDALTDCMEDLLKKKIPGAAKLVHHVHAAIERHQPDDEPPLCR